jgi:uncharacterized protein YjiS (DUF1127 family)
MLRNAYDYLAHKLGAQRLRAQISRELSTYSERELADMGLRREDIARIARESARGFEQAAQVHAGRLPSGLAPAQPR